MEDDNGRLGEGMWKLELGACIQSNDVAVDKAEMLAMMVGFGMGGGGGASSQGGVVFRFVCCP